MGEMGEMGGGGGDGGNGGNGGGILATPPILLQGHQTRATGDAQEMP